MFDAYTIKKVLPRLFIGIILIQLSWPLFTLLVQIVSEVAWGLEGLLYIPFGGRDQLGLDNVLAEAAGEGATLISILGVAGVGVYAVALGPGALIALGIAIILALLIGFFVLAIRQVVLVVLLVTAPLAIAAWILPNTEKFWKIWWESFSKLLLMYPMILLLIAGGRVASYLAAEGGGGVNLGNDAFQVAIVLLAFFGPFFLIPKTFQLAGSAFANIAGVMNDRSRGAFDRLKNFRANQVKQRHEDRMEGKTWLGSGRTGSLYQRASMLGSNGSWSPTKAGRRKFDAVQQKALSRTAAEMLENDGGFASGNDHATKLAAQQGMTRDKFLAAYQQLRNPVTDKNYTEAEARTALAQLETSFGGRMGSEALRVASARAAFASTTAFDPSAAGKKEMFDIAGGLVRDGLISTSDAASMIKANKARADQSSAGFVDVMKNVEKGSKGNYTEADGRAFTKLAFEGADSREILGGHTNTAKAFAEQAELNLKEAVSSAKPEDIDRALADAANIHSALSSTSPKKAEQFEKNVLSQGAKISGTRPDPLTGELVERELTYRELIDEARSNPALHSTFHDRVREYGSGREYQGAQSAGLPFEPGNE